MDAETNKESNPTPRHFVVLIVGAFMILAGCVLGVAKWQWFEFEPPKNEFGLDLIQPVDPYAWMTVGATCLIIVGFTAVIFSAIMRGRAEQ